MHTTRRAAARPSRPAAAPGPEGPGPPFLLLVLLLLPAAAPALKIPLKPRKELVDCRSPVVAHESAVAAGVPWKVGETAVTFERAQGKWIAAVSRPGQALPDRTTIAKLPALFEVPGPGGAYGLSVRASADGESLRVASAQGGPVPMGKVTAWLVDSDRDGVLGSEGDGVVVPGARTVAPFMGEAWHADAAVAVRRTEGGGPEEWTVEDLPMPYPDRADHAAAWRLVNWRRQQVGVRPLAHDAALEDGMRKHAAYCRRHSFKGHEEDKARAGWTPEGAEAGVGSVLNYPFGPSTLVEEVKVQLATLYHRNQVLAGGLLRSALVRHEGMFGMRVSTDPDAPLLEVPIVFPPHGMEGAPRRFHPDGEHPRPMEGFPRAPGPAVAVMLWALHFTPDLPAPPVLVLEGPDGKPIGGAFHHPGRPPKTGVPKDNFGAIALVPAAPLVPLSLHRARVRVPLPEVEGGGAFEYDWEFTTGE